MSTTKRKKKNFPFIGCMLLALSLTACGKTGKLNEGDCKCNIVFSEIPKEFQMLEESLLDRFEIEVTLQNDVTEKEYDIILNQDNDYFAQVSLNPGTYEIINVSNNMEYYNGLSISSDVESVELSSDITSEISITLDSTREFSKNWMAIQPMPEILLAEQFSREIQINRKVIDISEIVSELSLSYDDKVKPNQEIQLTDEDYGITVSLLNTGDEKAYWMDCEVVGVLVQKNTVVFPEGITLGMSAEDVLHKTDGLYGEPDSFTGTLLFGWGHDNVQAIYTDSESDDKMTITLVPDGSYVMEIYYELASAE